MEPTIEKTSLEGLVQIQGRVFNDNRGQFLKNYSESFFKKNGLLTNFPEEFITTSAKNVLRGLHFQTPPHEHVKLVTCVWGQVWDVVVDLRRSSPTYGKHQSFSLKGGEGRSLYIPPGFAHGFLSLENNSIVHYQVSSEHSPTHDAGVLWSSLNIPWPVDSSLLVISPRDQKFEIFSVFQSPF